LGVWVVVSALLPIAVNRYGVHDRPLWLSCAVVALALWATFLFIFIRSPENRASNAVVEPVDRLFRSRVAHAHRHRRQLGPRHPRRVAPGVSEALYVTALTAGVVFAGYTLLALTLGQEHDLDPGPPDRPRDQGVARPSTE
jgi:hypothetical protein